CLIKYDGLFLNDNPAAVTLYSMLTEEPILYPKRAKQTCRFSIDALAHKARVRLQSVFHNAFIGAL
ncbi:MAG: hypothetical protein JSV50_06700, partial [Desulfobacteraceae bacterium]